MIIGAIEAGGTKFLCGLLDADSQDYAKPTILARESIPTTNPETTLEAAIDFFVSASEEHKGIKLDAIGIGSFGPVDLKSSSPTWGYITATPKPGWKDTSPAISAPSSACL
jgi:fructokinase